MGQNEICTTLKSITTLSRNLFDFLEVVGKGGFGKVWKVQFLKNKMFFALKEMSKSKIIEKQMLNNVFQEKEILSNLYHPYLVNLYCTFQDTENLYMVMDYLPCSDLRYQIKFIKLFNEDQLRFIAACVTLGLEYIHSNGIIHRDIKPENLVIEERGFFRITDFGIAKAIEPDTFLNDISGTPGYIPPEVVNGDRVSFESDYFALGVILYELAMGDRPFLGKNKKEMLEDFSKDGICLTPEICGYSKDLCDFINKLLIFDKYQRLGRNGANEVKSHKIFSEFNWKHLYHKTVRSPFVPKIFVEKDSKRRLSQRKSENNSKDTNDSDSISISKKNDSFQNNFVNYTFIHKLNGNTQNVNYYNSKLQQKSSQVTKSFRAVAASPQKIIQIAPIKKTPIKLLSTSKKKNYQNVPNKIGNHSVSKFSCELPAIKNNKKNSYYTSNTSSTNNSLLGAHYSKSPIKRSASNNNMFKNFILKSACKNMKMSNTNLNTFSQTKLFRKSSKFNTIISNIHTKTNFPNTIFV